jgi:cytochrome c oxidase subunit I
MSTPAIGGVHARHSYLDDSTRKGIFGWILSTDHKRIGVLYLFTMLTFFFVAVTLGVLMRIEPLTHNPPLFAPETYNAFFTVHGVIMIFLFVLPGLSASFGNFFLPILIGARDVAFPRLNLMSWYFFVTGALIVGASLFTGKGPPDTGWTFYVPYSIRTSTNVTLGLFGVFVLGFSSILTGLNFITTVHRMRAPGMTWHRMPLFVWSLYATAWIQVLATPILGITLLLVIVERLFGVGIFDPAKGGDPVLYQHMFWIYSHPAVYIMIVPAMGAITEVIPTFAHRAIFGYRAIAYSSLGIAALGSLVWGHHMFTSGMGDPADLAFSLLTFLVAVPSSIKVFNWTATLYKGSIELRPPMLFALGFLFLFMIGGLTGLIQGALAVNVHVHDTYWIVGHFHYVMFGGTGMGFFAALLYWFPKMFGRMYNEKAATASWVLIFIGFNTFYFSMLILGYMGMPRRYFTHLPQFDTMHTVASIGAFIMVAGLLLFFANLAASFFRGGRAVQNPWGGVTLEWQIPTPPPVENFEEIPTITGRPYAFNPETTR